jgi:hypothetical protein
MLSGAARVLGEPPFAPPTSKDQCKEDGWETFRNPNFNNQGACVSYVATHSRNGGDG